MQGYIYILSIHKHTTKLQYLCREAIPFGAVCRSFVTLGILQVNIFGLGE